MTTLPCPLPQVDEALRPYIHARQETLRIRKVLAEHLQSQIQQHVEQGAESTAITSLTLACSPPSLLPETQANAPPELTGLRKRYWEAVQAHQLAKKRRDALHSELDELQQESHNSRSAVEPRNFPPFTTTAPFPAIVPESSSQDTQNYIALLHQRRRHAKLQILLDALDRIADTQPNPLQRDVRQWVKDKLGDAPVPPLDMSSGSDGANSAAAISSSEDAAKDEVLRLKKELLLAKQSLDAERDRRAAAGGSQAGQSIEAQVVALRAARDELIAWIESELAKLAEGDESVLCATPPRQQHDEAAADARDDESAKSDRPVQEQVEALYERYVAARASLVAAADTAAAVAKAASSAPSPPQQHAPSSSAAEPTQSLPPSAVLPFVPALLQSARDERALVQQSTYLRHRIARAQEEARGTMQRLASESHMVAPGAESGLAWARKAVEAAGEMEGVVVGRLAAGEANVEGARAILGELEARRRVFGGLRGEV